MCLVNGFNLRYLNHKFSTVQFWKPLFHVREELYYMDNKIDCLSKFRELALFSKVINMDTGQHCRMIDQSEGISWRQYIICDDKTSCSAVLVSMRARSALHVSQVVSVRHVCLRPFLHGWQLLCGPGSRVVCSAVQNCNPEIGLKINPCCKYWSRAAAAGCVVCRHDQLRAGVEWKFEKHYMHDFSSPTQSEIRLNIQFRMHEWWYLTNDLRIAFHGN